MSKMNDKLVKTKGLWSSRYLSQFLNLQGVIGVKWTTFYIPYGGSVINILFTFLRYSESFTSVMNDIFKGHIIMVLGHQDYFHIS